LSDAIPLPSRVDLEQYKRLAKDFQRACQSRVPHAIRDCAARWLERLARLEHSQITPDVRRRIDREAARLDRHWDALQRPKRDRECVLADAQFFVARAHGFSSWATFVHHVESLAHISSVVSSFEAAVDAIVRGDAATLQQLLHDHPELTQERSTREHRSTLLHYISANGVEDFRQRTPKNIVEIARILLDAGADVNAESDAYGGGSTTLGLVATSIHPAEAGVQIALLDTLLGYGARLEQRSATGQWRSVINDCIANGQPAAAEFLRARGAPLDFESAAALGDLEFIARSASGPNPLDIRISKEQLESAFRYACGYGRSNVVDFFLERGVHPRTHDVQSGLHWAAYSADINIVRRLLEHGWRVDIKHPDLGATPLEVAIQVWADTTDVADRDRSYEVIALLVRAGATIDPEWCDRDDDRRVLASKMHADARMQAALRGEVVR
jgi:ankyrin repeat protein